MQLKLTSATPTFTVRAVTPTPSAADDVPELVVVVVVVPLFAALLHEASTRAPENITIIPERDQRRTERHPTTGRQTRTFTRGRSVRRPPRWSGVGVTRAGSDRRFPGWPGGRAGCPGRAVESASVGRNCAC